VPDSLSHAKDALGRGEPTEALVHLWSALDAAQAEQNAGDLVAVERMAETIAAKGDDADAAEAERLLREIDRAAGEDSAETVTVEPGSFEPAHVPTQTTEPDEVEEKPASKGARLWRLIPFALFLFFILRDVWR
jgi:hypothetical protein